MADTPESSAAGVEQASAQTQLQTKLGKKWLRKFIIFLVVSIGFGIYGLYDATIAYPNRGEKDASYRLLEYLRAADDAHGLALPLGIPNGQTPQEYLDALHEREQELFEKAAGEGRSGARRAGRYGEDGLARFARQDLAAHPRARRGPTSRATRARSSLS
jgi:hypothetical protein